MGSWVWVSIHTKGGMTYETYTALTRHQRETLHDELNRYIEEENRRIEKASKR